MNFKNETGYTKVKRSPMVIQPLSQHAANVDSSESEVAPVDDSIEDRKDNAEEEEKIALRIPSPADIHEEDSKM